MSFGFSVGDFLVLSQLALNVYNSCRGASAEFKSIASEASTLSFVLKRLSSDFPHRTLDEEDTKELVLIHTRTREALEDIQGLLQKYRSLEQQKPRKLDRIKWALKPSSDVRTKLLFHAGVLNCLNTSLIKYAAPPSEHQFPSLSEGDHVAYMRNHRLSQDRVEQSVTSFIKNFTDSATAPAEQDPLDDALSTHRPALDQLAASDRLTSCTSLIPETPTSQCSNCEGDNYLRSGGLSEGPSWDSALSGESATTVDDKNRLLQAGNIYQHVKGLGNSLQINGDIGQSTTDWSCRRNTYFDVVAEGDSIQLNGHVLDLSSFLSAAKS
ncbi:hypothetical protein DL771_002857 [Monosporascus sp. 5C6A]|nr:hypothetical protein DL771_002857 [Monosporascus sp. 5C6A]